MDYLSLIKRPIERELADFIAHFNGSMTAPDGLLDQALQRIRQHSGKRMRPMLILLMAKNYGNVSAVTQYAAVGLELLHTASLVHDDVVDESKERRGQASVNEIYDNKVAVLVGDYILSTALLYISFTHSETIVRYLANLGRTLSNGEILQLSNIQNKDISEEVYYNIIKGKTAALFEACAAIGASSAGITGQEEEEAKAFGQNLGVIFQIRDDIFDYYESGKIGKPTGNDMREGKLSLPVIYALRKSQNSEMLRLAAKVKDSSVTSDEIHRLVDFTKAQGGIEYAENQMWMFHDKCQSFINDHVSDSVVKEALQAYLDYVIRRDK